VTGPEKTEYVGTKYTFLLNEYNLLLEYQVMGFIIIQPHKGWLDFHWLAIVFSLTLLCSLVFLLT